MPTKTVTVPCPFPRPKNLKDIFLYHAALEAAGAKTMFRGRVIVNIQVYPPPPESKTIRRSARRGK